MIHPDETAALSSAERAYIRRELHGFFGTLPTAAEGFMLRTRRTGPEAGRPKLPPAASSLVARGLMQVVEGRPWHRLVFTEAGLAALRAMLERAPPADRVNLAHVRRELGLEPGPAGGDAG